VIVTSVFRLSSGLSLAAVLLTGVGTAQTSKPVNKGGAPGLIRAAAEFVGVDLLSANDGRLMGSLTPVEVTNLAALVRDGSAREAQTSGAPWPGAVLRIRTRSHGVYVVYLMDGDTLRLEVPTAVARQLGVAPGLARNKRVEVQLRYERWLYQALEARLGPSKPPGPD
jgi:hypothetical protein